jgi:peptide/nickel transport system permease protein
MASAKQNDRFLTALKVAVGIAAVAVLVFAEFIAPYAYDRQQRDEPNAPASTIRFIDSDGNFHTRPFVYRRAIVDRLAFGYEEVTDERFPVTLFVRGGTYSVVGLISTDVHLFGVASDTARITLLGTDSLGRDRFSRLIVALRFSLIVCLLGTLFASLIGIVFGMVSGFSGRIVDTVMMGIADSVLALPTLILILAARAAFPLELPPMRAATLMVVIFSVAGWAQMARFTRSLVRSTREQEYVKAAKAVGCTESAILAKHIFPNIAPALVTQASIMLPYFLLTEVALSFLGVGLQEPVPSLGNLLAAASDLGQLQQHPILLLSPAVAIFIFVFIVRLMSRRARRSETGPSLS